MPKERNKADGYREKAYEGDTKAMFARERRSRERYNCFVAEDATMPVGSFFNEES